MPPHDAQRDSDALDARTLVQSTEGVAASVELSIPHHVRQHASAPKLPGYILAEPLGEGAYGQVWRAWQMRTHKEVAIKVFLQRSGLDWLFLQREVERLTRLDKHPHIVTLLDTNLDEEPPFYVMELVGRGSLQQCVTENAPADARRAIRWMTQIVDALSYVHGKGMIHCDLKPANILIDERDSIRVVDFGQSRVFTESSASLGTLFYMAPEQAVPAQAGTPVHPDVRWDVYALGATLYAILTGHVPYATPINVQQMKQATTLDQRLSHYRELIDHDPRPSWGHSQVNPEVRAIIDKCMAPIAAQRYGAVAEIAADLRAVEENRPVTPLAGSNSYRTRKFVQRNKGTVAAITAVILALIVGLAGTGFMYFRAVDQRDRAQEAERLTQESLAETEQARDEAEQVTQFLTDTLAAADPSEQGRDVTVREVLDRTSETISTKFADKPLIEARVKLAVGWTYVGLGLHDKAEVHLAEAAVIYRRVLGGRDPRTINANDALAISREMRGKYGADEAYFRTTLETQRNVLGPEHRGTLLTMNNWANWLDHQGRYAEGEVLHRKTLDIQLRVLGEKHPDTLQSMNNLAAALYDQERYAEAEELFRKTLDIQLPVLGEKHPDTLMSMSNLADTLEIQGRHAEAEELCRRTLGIERLVLSAEHPYTLESMKNLAVVLEAEGRYLEAEELAAEALSVWEKKGEATSATPWLTTSVRGGALTGLGRFDEAEPLLVGAHEAIKDRGDVPPADKRRALGRIVRLYESWDAAEPDKGHAEKAAEWRAKLDETSKSKSVEKSK